MYVTGGTVVKDETYKRKGEVRTWVLRFISVLIDKFSTDL